MKYFKTPERLDGKRLLLNAKKGQFIQLVAYDYKPIRNGYMGYHSCVIAPFDGKVI